MNAFTVVVCLRPRADNYIEGFREDFRSVEFKDSAIIIVRDSKPLYQEDITYPLILCNKEIDSNNYFCHFCDCRFVKTDGYVYNGGYGSYFGFHKECMELVMAKTKNLYHPKHSLQILIYRYAEKRCYSCYSSRSNFLYCSICDFGICYICVQELPLLTIENKKRHEHTLSYIPRKASMTCDVCALDDRRFFIYICQQCDFVVHKECIYFPYVIKISRHEHRLSFTSSFLPGKWFCRVCRKNIDGDYGGYSCVVKGCYCVVHSRCAIYNDVWDGKELEGEPEDTYEDTTSFKEIDDGIIQHFRHNHYMRLHKEIDKAYEEKLFCEACALPLYDGNIFSCMECDFVLHKVCAYLPLKKQHVIHPHTLVLQECNPQDTFCCSACGRECNSFRYKCEICWHFQLDVHCASISEPQDHHCHKHLLFLPSKSGSSATCSICQVNSEYHRPYYLECGECDFALCFGCATLPKKFMYKHDEHPLIFSLGQEASDEYWCDVCEKKINPKHGTYMCNDCDVTLHIKCLLGKDMYMLPGKTKNVTTKFQRISHDILLNNHLTRDICQSCYKRCQNKITYKKRLDGPIYCSLSCLSRHYQYGVGW